MARDRLQGFTSFLKSLDMRRSYQIHEEVPRKKSCKKKLVFPSLHDKPTTAVATTDDDTDDDYNLLMPTPLPSQANAGNRKRPVSLPALDAKNDQEPPTKRLRFQQFSCETCNSTFFSQSELDDHKISCVIDIISEQSASPEVSFMLH